MKDKVEQKDREMFHGEGRVVIRPSGTEPLVRVMIEGKIEKKSKILPKDQPD